MTLLDYLYTALIGGAFGVLLGSVVERRDWRRFLIKRGLAEYKVDEHGNPEWKWKS